MTRSQSTPASSQIITLTRMLEEREETMYAQAAVIERMRWYIQGYCTEHWGKEALAIPTDSTQILDEVRRAERERVAEYVDRNLMSCGEYAEAIRAME